MLKLESKLNYKNFLVLESKLNDKLKNICFLNKTNRKIGKNS